jgi:PAS domain S-box-containing protein
MADHRTSFHVAWVRYALPPLLLAAAGAVTLALRSTGLLHTPAAFLGAVLVATWYGGTAVGLLTLVAAAIIFQVFFLDTAPGLERAPSAGPYLVSFVLFAVLSVWFGALRQRTQRAIEQARDDLEERVAARTADLERLNRELRRSEAYLAEAQMLSQIGSWAWSPISRENVYWSREVYRIYGFDPSEGMASYQAATGRVHPDDRARFDSSVQQAIAERTDFRVQHRLLMPDGTAKYVRTVGHPVFNESGGLVEFVGVVMDVTRRRRAGRALRRARERALTARFAAMLEERTRLAREVHDTLIQGFTGVSLKLVAVSGRLSGPPEAVGGLRDVLVLAQRTLEDARRAIWDMRSAALADANLPAAVTAAARQIALGTPISLDVSVQGDPYPLDPNVEDAVLRVAQEAVANAVKHAEARQVRLVLVYEPRGMRLSVEDDGRGFAIDPDFRAYAGHWGLLGMRERALRAHGRLEIGSAAGKGTRVTLSVPAPGGQPQPTDTPA